MIVDVRNTIGSFAGSILDFIYPPLCVCCENLLVDGNENVCSICWESLKRVEDTLPLFVQTRDKLLASGVVDELISTYVFEKEGPLQKIVHALKYSGIQSLGIELGRRLGLSMNERHVRADLVTPVPLHRRKMRERGYNQSELIARGVSKVASIPANADYVRRTRFTQTQTKLSLEERKVNMAGAFFCNTTCVKGSTIILLDDIITTGATIQSCAEVLKDAGACRIIAASVALAA